MCSRHYQQWRKRAPRSELRPHLTSVKERLEFYSREEGECVVWTGSMDGRGYGFITVDGVHDRAHRAAWEQEYGPIPEGKVVDHLCHRRSCIRLSHLRLATRQENARNRAGATAGSATGIRGVRLVGPGCWEVTVWLGGGRLWSRRYDSLEMATIVAPKVRRHYFGDFAGKG